MIEDLPFPGKIVSEQEVQLFIRVTPKARENSVRHVRWWGNEGEDGKFPVLCLSVQAPAEDNKANNAMLKLLSEFLQIPGTSVTLCQGHTSRFKTVRISPANFPLLQKKIASVRKR